MDNPTSFTLSDGVIKWEIYSNENKICSRFSSSEWNLITSLVDSDDEFETLVSQNNFIDCYILKHFKTDAPIAFVLTMNIGLKVDKVFIHGGGWGKSMRLSLLYYRGMILMIEYLLKQSYKIRSSCLITNTRAFRFLHSLGFVKYCTTKTHHYMWINEKRLRVSKIYEYLYPPIL